MVQVANINKVNEEVIAHILIYSYYGEEQYDFTAPKEFIAENFKKGNTLYFPRPKDVTDKGSTVYIRIKKIDYLEEPIRGANYVIFAEEINVFGEPVEPKYEYEEPMEEDE